MKADRILTKTETIGACPACSEKIEATLNIAVRVGDPVLDDNGGVTAEVTSEVTSVRVIHRCDGKPAPTSGETPEPAPSLDPPAEA